MMKKFTSIFLVLLFLSFNFMGVKASAIGSNTFNQGIYKTTDLNVSKNSIYTITNLSKSDGMFISILDDNLAVMEAIRVLPDSPKVDTIPIKAGYKIIILGKGNVYFTPQQF